MTELSAELTGKLSAAVENMPAFPRSVQQILEITRDINCKPRELVAVIENDPVMTIKLLRILNSAYYSFPNPVTSVNQSVVYLGINTIKNMALSFATVGVLPAQNAAGFDIRRYLLHSLTTAGLARLVCQKFCNGAIDPVDCHIAGLLHDFGKVVFAQFMPAEFKEAIALSEERNVPLHVAEKRVIGADHSLVGALLVERWQLPEFLSDAIRHHHDEVVQENGVQSCLFVADRISNRLSPGTSGNPWEEEELPPALAARFHGTVDDIVDRLGDLSRIREEAELFAHGM
jgi:putative nucleotidyltransferase with HDIG domain